MSHILRYDPFREFRRLIGDGFPVMDDVWQDMNAGMLSVDAFVEENNVVVKADLPGVNSEDVDISVTGDSVTIKAERKEEKEVQDRDYIRKERRYGSAARTISLPAQVKVDQAEAHFENGTLIVTIPKQEQSEPKQIKIKVSKDASS